MIIQADTHCSQEENVAMQKQLQLLRNRRVKDRPINGSVDLYLPETEKQARHPFREKLIHIMDDIENAELGVMDLSETGTSIIEESRRKRMLANELKLRINRLTEEFEDIVKVLPFE